MNIDDQTFVVSTHNKMYIIVKHEQNCIIYEVKNYIIEELDVDMSTDITEFKETTSINLGLISRSHDVSIHLNNKELYDKIKSILSVLSL